MYNIIALILTIYLKILLNIYQSNKIAQMEVFMNITKAIHIAKKARLNACARDYYVGACLVTKSR